MKKIRAFTGIRFIWAISIVICHLFLFYQEECAQIGIGWSFLSHGGWGVTSFFVLSGFLVNMHYGEKTTYRKESLFKAGISFWLNHLKKWYLLYIICMLPALLIEVVKLILAWNVKEFVELIVKLLMNLTLTQSWIPLYEYSLNGVAWYLSCLSALYIVTPLLLHINSKIRSNKKICVIYIIISLLLIVLIADKWGILYNHPAYRLLQYMIGIVLYNLLSKQVKACNGKHWTFIAAIIAVMTYVTIIPSMTSVMDTIFIICFITIYFNRDKADILSSKWFEIGGGMSLEIFLTHFPIIIYGGKILKLVLPANEISYIIQMLFLLGLCMLISYVYHYYIAKTAIICKMNKKIEGVIKNLLEKIK